MNILLIDDDERAVRPLRQNIERHFKARGIRLYHCATIKDGLRESKSDHSIKLVLLDLGMPCVKSPREAINFIPQFACSVACYSAHGTEELVQLAASAGAVAFISKYDRPEDQLRKLDEIVDSIAAAHVRMKAERQEGYLMTTAKSARFGMPILSAFAGACVAFLAFFSGEIKGAWNAAREHGAKEQEVADHFERLDHTTSLLEKSREDMIRGQRRLERNIDKLLMKEGIPPTRDDE